LLSLLILGLLVAVNWHLPTGMTEGLSLIFGVTHGAANGVAAVAAGVLRDLFVTGLLTAGVVLATLVPALVLSLRAAWSQVAVRVVGSWIAAVGLLMVAFALRPAQPPDHGSQPDASQMQTPGSHYEPRAVGERGGMPRNRFPAWAPPDRHRSGSSHQPDSHPRNTSASAPCRHRR
jgi:hypothetical protein